MLYNQYLKDLKLVRKSECHISPDWLLIYSRDITIKIVTLVVEIVNSIKYKTVTFRKTLKIELYIPQK